VKSLLKIRQVRLGALIAFALATLSAATLSFISKDSFATPTIESALVDEAAGQEPDTRSSLIMEVLEVRDALIEKAEHRKAEIGTEEYLKMVSKEQIEVPSNGHGRAKMTLIDGKEVVRVIHEPSELAFVFVDREQISEHSVHLQRYLARQNVRVKLPNGKLTGRDAIVVWFDDEVPEDGSLESKDLPKPKTGSLKWFKLYFKSIWQKPSKEEGVFGVSCGLVQAGLTCGVSALKEAASHLHMNSVTAVKDAASQLHATSETVIKAAAEHTGDGIIPAVLAGVFGTTIGVFSSTYREWTNSGTRFAQMAKSSVSSFLFNYTLIATTQGLHALNFFDPQGLMNHAFVWLNVIGNNLGKVAYTQYAIQEDELRMNTEPKGYRDLLKWVGKKLGHEEIGEVHVPLKPVEAILNMKFKASNIRNQSLYLLPFTFKLIDILNVGIHMGTHLIPVGKIIFWASVPVATYMVWQRVEKLTPEKVLDGQDLSRLTGAERDDIYRETEVKLQALRARYHQAWTDMKWWPIKTPWKLAKAVPYKEQR
jgi:hypothetical protein